MEWLNLSFREKRIVEKDIAGCVDVDVDDNTATLQEECRPNWDNIQSYSYIPSGKRMIMKLCDQHLYVYDLTTKSLKYAFKLSHKFQTLYCLGIFTYFKGHKMFCCVRMGKNSPISIETLVQFLYPLGSVETILISAPLTTLHHSNFIPYSYQQIQVRNKDGDVVHFVSKKRLHNYWLTADQTLPDTYFLYNHKYDVTPLFMAYIPDYKTSAYLNHCFFKTPINNAGNIDFLEESDDEGDCEITKAPDVSKKVFFQCLFSEKFNKWIPLKKIDYK